MAKDSLLKTLLKNSSSAEEAKGGQPAPYWLISGLLLTY